MAGKRYASFTPQSVAFLSELKANNNRDWFKENKTRYEELVLDVALNFIQSMQGPLEEIAPNFTAIPKRMGGSLMRVYRDTRFSKNKTPYKTNIGIQFRHEQAKDVHSPGYYVHIDTSRPWERSRVSPASRRASRRSTGPSRAGSALSVSNGTAERDFKSQMSGLRVSGSRR